MKSVLGLLLHPFVPELGTWVREGPKGGVTCCVCPGYSADTAKISNLKRHASSNGHRSKVHAKLGLACPQIKSRESPSKLVPWHSLQIII